MRLPKAELEAHPWVIAQIAPDFELIDAWALPAQGGRDDFDALLEIMAFLDGPMLSRQSPAPCSGCGIGSGPLAGVG
jgi:hypothetical protein